MIGEVPIPPTVRLCKWTRDVLAIPAETCLLLPEAHTILHPSSCQCDILPLEWADSRLHEATHHRSIIASCQGVRFDIR